MLPHRLRTPADIILLSGNSHTEFTQKVATALGINVGNCKVVRFANRETNVQVAESVRNRNVYIVQSGTTKDVNDAIMELLIMAYACKTSSACSVIAVVPYLPYSKQAKMRGRGCIVSKLVARMMMKAGVTQLITMDLLHKEIQGFFDIPVDNIRSQPLMQQYVVRHIPDYKTCVVVAKSPKQTGKASSFANLLNLNLAVIHRNDCVDDQVDHRGSPPLAPSHDCPSCSNATDSPRSRPASPNSSVTPSNSDEACRSTFVGHIDGKSAIMIENIIDDLDTFIAAAVYLKRLGALNIYVIATHAVITQDISLLVDSPIDKLIITNTVPQLDKNLRECPKVHEIDVCNAFAEAIRRVHNKESMAQLFRDVHLED